MKIYAPDYYKDFSCIADKCRHSCCIGWEIDIDDCTMELYKSIGGALGEKLKNNIVTDENNIHSFKLCEGERCPFLNSRGLCELILEKGEDILCDICTDHPRFRNFYSDRVELGLGLCCEEAARLVVSKEDKTKILLLSDDDYEEESLTDSEKELLTVKNTAIALISDRSKSYNDRVRTLCNLRAYSGRELYDILFPLERLDREWDNVLSALLKSDKADTDGYDTVCEQLAVYFVFRHLNMECDNLERAVSFALFSVNAIIKLSRAYYGNDVDLSQIAEIARMYSAEVEYSDCNIDEIMDKI